MLMRMVTLSAIPLLLFLSISASAQHLSKCNDSGFETLHEQGKIAFEKLMYENCADAFACAFQLKPKNLLRFSIAACLDGAKQYQEALEYYKAYVDGETHPKKNQWFVNQATRRIEEIPSQLAHLVFDVTPIPAEVRIGNTSVILALKNQRVTINPGSHDITIQSERYQEYTTHRELHQGDETTIRATLEKEDAQLSIRCNDPSALVFVNSKVAGTCPMVDFRIPEGRLHIKVVAPERLPYEQTVVATAGQTLIIRAKLPERAPDKKAAFKKISTASLIAGGGGVLGIGIADLIISLMAHKADARVNNEVVSSNDYDSYQDAKTRYQRWMGSNGRILGYVAGGAVFATGVGLWIYHRSILLKQEERAHPANADFRISPSGVLVAF